MEPEEADIELRSEKARSIIGQIPNRIIRFGTFIVSVIIIGILLACYYVKYPLIIKVATAINSKPPSIPVYAPESGIFIVDTQRNSTGKLDLIAAIETIGVDSKPKLIKIISPIKGMLSFNYQLNDMVRKGETILFIRPDTITGYTCQSFLPSRYISKLKIGQQANIELNNFPINEFGFIAGKIGKIYPMPIVIENQSFFKIEIDLPHNLKTSTGEKITVYPNIEGYANILLNEVTIFKALFKYKNQGQPYK